MKKSFIFIIYPPYLSCRQSNKTGVHSNTHKIQFTFEKFQIRRNNVASVHIIQWQTFISFENPFRSLKSTMTSFFPLVSGSCLAFKKLGEKRLGFIHCLGVKAFHLWTCKAASVVFGICIVPCCQAYFEGFIHCCCCCCCFMGYACVSIKSKVKYLKMCYHCRAGMYVYKAKGRMAKRTKIKGGIYKCIFGLH